MGTDPKIQSIPADLDERAASVLAAAFRNNPLDVAVIGGSPRFRAQSVRWGMRASLAAARRGETSALLGAWEAGTGEGDPLGVLLALPSSALPLPPPPLVDHLRSTLGQGLRATRRWGEVFRELARYQPEEDHWYLSLLGVHESQRRRGLGSALLRRWLEDVDRDRLPAYLETDRQENLVLYRDQGFEVFAETAVLGASIWCMRRPVA